jgi:DNA-directed RNA polymerase subunit beta'
MTEVQRIYASQGQTINDKHIEIIARQMLSKIRILEPGGSNYLPGELIDVMKAEELNKEFEKKGEKPIKGERLLLGLTRVSLCTESWLSAASFQETIRVLVEASTTNKLDNLEGLKENVIIGKLIPAGETYKKRHPDIIADQEKQMTKEGKVKQEELKESEESPFYTDLALI